MRFMNWRLATCLIVLAKINAAWAQPTNPNSEPPNPTNTNSPATAAASTSSNSNSNSIVQVEDIIKVGQDVILRANQKTSDLIAVFGQIQSDGEVTGQVISVFGDTIVNGPVGND